MDNTTSKLRRDFLTQATTAKRSTGLPDNAIVGAMLSAAHGFALRRDPTPRYLDAIFDAAESEATP